MTINVFKAWKQRNLGFIHVYFGLNIYLGLYLDYLNESIVIFLNRS